MVKRSKYHNTKVEYGGMKFDSKKELKRWLQLLDLEKTGEISNLRRQVEYTLIPNFYKTEIVRLKTKTKTVEKFDGYGVKYCADFVYNTKSGEEIVEDVKALTSKGKFGVVDKSYLLKKKMMRYLLGIIVKEV